MDDDLFAAVDDVINRYHERHENDIGSALTVLEVLGFMAGRIFSYAPDPLTRQIGHTHFTSAIEAGLHRGTSILH